MSIYAGAGEEHSSATLAAAAPIVSRHEARIARILTLCKALEVPVSVSYLDSCDVRALPVLLERLERLERRRARRWAFRMHLQAPSTGGAPSHRDRRGDRG